MTEAVDPDIDPLTGQPWRYRDNPTAYKRRYNREHRAGIRRIKPVEVRLLDRLDRIHGSIPTHAPELGPCWVWQGAVNGDGYGIVSVDGRLQLVHRLTLAIALERPVAADRYACHRCENRRCGRPSHLYEGSMVDNNRDVAATIARRKEEREHLAAPAPPP